MKKILVLLCTTLLSCGNQKNEKLSTDTQERFFNINYEEALENKREYCLSEIASDVQYVPLESNDSSYLRPVVDYFFTDSLILVRNFDHILKFSRDGKFLHKIGKPGRGPGEIDLVRVMTVIPEKRLIVIQLNYQRKLYYLSLDGELLKIVDFLQPISEIKVCPDGRYILHERVAGGYEKYSFCLTTEDWDTLSLVKNNMNWENNTGRVISIAYNTFDPYYRSGDRMYMKDMYNDTVYCTEGDSIRAAYFVDLGRYRLPGDLRPEKLGVSSVSQFFENSDKYYFGTLHESAGKVFLATHCYSERSGNPSKYILYDRTTEQTVFLTDGNEPARGFLNDLDGIMISGRSAV